MDDHEVCLPEQIALSRWIVEWQSSYTMVYYYIVMHMNNYHAHLQNSGSSPFHVEIATCSDSASTSIQTCVR